MDERALRAILAMDKFLPHDEAVPEDTPRPEWCRYFCPVLGCGEEDPCCGMFLELSPMTFSILEKEFQ